MTSPPPPPPTRPSAAKCMLESVRRWPRIPARLFRGQCSGEGGDEDETLARRQFLGGSTSSWPAAPRRGLRFNLESRNQGDETDRVDQPSASASATVLPLSPKKYHLFSSVSTASESAQSHISHVRGCPHISFPRFPTEWTDTWLRSVLYSTPRPRRLSSCLHRR